MRTRFLAPVLLFAFLLVGCGSEATHEKPRNLILMIGDGMGVAAIMQAKVAKGNVSFERFHRGGIMTTHPLNDDTWVTDSAASATAMATGHKTVRGLLNLLPAQGGGYDTLRIFTELAKKRGKSVGIVVTCAITNATPAAFYAHSKRYDEQNIARQFVSRQLVDVAFGGGRSLFLPKGVEGSGRSDSLDLLGALESKGYTVISEPGKLASLDPLKTKKVVGLFALGALPQAPERKPNLSEMLEKALAILNENPQGFFLMVEGSQIDWAAHDHDAEWEEAETIEFEEAVGKALDFARKEGHTLVLATADHETGGMALEGGSQSRHTIEARYILKEHSANPVAFFVDGPSSERFGGMIDNTTIGQVFWELLQ
ncbi:MAG: alkaline phosphatase [Calditrichaeota bacterium]|nr:alkaline phosphatase [Calditrichota bacterium]